MEREISVMTSCHNRFSKGSTMNRIEYNKDKDGFIYVICELFKDTREVSQSIQI